MPANFGRLPGFPRWVGARTTGTTRNETGNIVIDLHTDVPTFRGLIYAYVRQLRSKPLGIK